MGGPEVTRFLTSLAVDGHVAGSTQNQALSALLFLYREVLARELRWLDDIVRAKRTARLPVVPTHDEVRAVIRQLRGRKGDKDRATPLPAVVIADLTKHLEGVRRQHDADLRHGAGWVELPWALVRKCPNAAREWAWQWCSRPHASTLTGRPINAAATTVTSPCSTAP
jgi:hypothetical protein